MIRTSLYKTNWRFYSTVLYIIYRKLIVSTQTYFSSAKCFFESYFIDRLKPVKNRYSLLQVLVFRRVNEPSKRDLVEVRLNLYRLKIVFRLLGKLIRLRNNTVLLSEEIGLFYSTESRRARFWSLMMQVWASCYSLDKDSDSSPSSTLDQFELVE